MFDKKKFVVFGCDGNHPLDVKILKEVKELSHKTLRFHHINYGEYPDGELDIRIPNNKEIKGKNAIVFQSAYSSELKEEFLDICAAIYNQYNAKRIIAVMPFMYGRRQDHEEDMSEINRNYQFIKDMAARGVKYLILCDIHSQSTIKSCAKENIEVFNVDPALAYAAHLRLLVEIAQEDGRLFCVYSPDAGSIPRAVGLARVLDLPIAIDFKKRNKDGSIERVIRPAQFKKLVKQYSGVKLVLADEKLKGASICVREDELSTGGTARMAGEYLRDVINVHELFFCVTHAVCAPGWKRKFSDFNPYNNTFIGNTIPRGYKNSTGGQITAVDMSRVMAHQLIKVIRKL